MTTSRSDLRALVARWRATIEEMRGERAQRKGLVERWRALLRDGREIVGEWSDGGSPWLDAVDAALAAEDVSDEARLRAEVDDLRLMSGAGIPTSREDEDLIDAFIEIRRAERAEDEIARLRGIVHAVVEADLREAAERVAAVEAERDRYRRRLMSESARMADALDLLDDYDYSEPWTDEDLVTSGSDVIEAARQVIEAARDLGLVPGDGGDDE